VFSSSAALSTPLLSHEDRAAAAAYSASAAASAAMMRDEKGEAIGASVDVKQPLMEPGLVRVLRMKHKLLMLICVV
jgi:hypothetical protein